MYVIIVLSEQLAVQLAIGRVKQAKPLSDMAIVGQVGPILRAAFQYHGAKLDFLPWAQLQLQ